MNPILRQLIFSMHSCLSSLWHYSPYFVPLGSNTITKHALRHPYRTRSKSRAMGEVEEVQKQMKANMSALKDKMASMMEAMLSMRRLIQVNAAASAVASIAAEADPVLSYATNHAHQLAPDMVGRGGDTLRSTGGLHLGYNRNAYPYGLPPPPISHRPPCTITWIMLFPLPSKVSFLSL